MSAIPFLVVVAIVAVTYLVAQGVRGFDASRFDNDGRS